MKDKTVGGSMVPVWILRNNMSFIIDNILIYTQVDVIESQHSKLMLQLQSTKDFENIMQAHEKFIVAVMDQTFRYTPLVSRTSCSIFI